MHKKYKTSLFFILILILGLSSCTTNYYIVRHAEKADSTPNTALSAAGFQRAEDLQVFLADKGIDNIYTSNYLRTQQTAQPTADATGVVPVIYAVPNEFQAMITQLKSHTDNRSILVVNHSNTVPEIVDSLMQSPQGINIPESEFDNIYHVKVKRGTSVIRSLHHYTFGQPTN